MTIYETIVLFQVCSCFMKGKSRAICLSEVCSMLECILQYNIIRDSNDSHA